MNFITHAFHHLRWLVRGVKVFALIGRSGTGKSFRALLLAKKYNIELIVDDGLVIRDQKILAGRSSKREKAYLTAIKTALFTEDQQRREALAAIKREKFHSILILGTSLGMVTRIARRLELPAPSRVIAIEDISTEEEIKQAMKSRKTEGKHIIPVPALEVKRNYPHLIYETIKIFLTRRFFRSEKERMFEKTVVRPEFSRRGKLEISEVALSQMVLHCVSEFNPSLKIEKIQVRREFEGFQLAVHLRVSYGLELSRSIPDLQTYIVDNIESFSGIRLSRVDILISKIERPS
jgi:ABC-type dipeptide/oligopeptide/nickel transport system ATPase component